MNKNHRRRALPRKKTERHLYEMPAEGATYLPNVEVAHAPRYGVAELAQGGVCIMGLAEIDRERAAILRARMDYCHLRRSAEITS